MEFFQYFEFDNSTSEASFPRLNENKIQTNISSIENVIFSLGTYERHSYEQLFFPIYKGTNEFNNTIIFGIDPEYSISTSKESRFISIKDKQYKFSYLFSFKEIQCFYEFDKNIQLYIISSSIKTEHPGFRAEAAESFAYSKDCSTTSEQWSYFYKPLELLIRNDKCIFINNWVFTNSRFFKLINGSYKSFFTDIGHYFEYFPEIGFILNQLYGCWSSRNSISIYITSFTNKMTILPIEKTELSIL